MMSRGRGGTRARGNGGGRGGRGGRGAEAGVDDVASDVQATIRSDLAGHDAMPYQVMDAVQIATPSLRRHVSLLQRDRPAYICELQFLLHSTEVPRASKVVALLAAFETHDDALIKLLLSQAGLYGIPEVLAAARALDAQRRLRSLAKKISTIALRPEVAAAARHQADGRDQGRCGKRVLGADDRNALPRAVRKALTKLALFKNEVATREAEHPDGLTATLSGHATEYFRTWMYSITRARLEHFAVEFGLEQWKELADRVHPNPNRMQLQCFLPIAFEKRVGTVDRPPQLKFAVGELAKARSIDAVLDRVVKLRLPYTMLRRKFKPDTWSTKAKVQVAAYTDMTTLLWWFEELSCVEVDDLVVARLGSNDHPTFGYGKLMERLMCCFQRRSRVFPHLMPCAERKLMEYTLPLRTPMAVLGDCSGSMQVAVRTATIIVSLLTALGSADIFFFNDKCIRAPFTPETIKEALICAEEIRADGATAPAAALEPLFLSGTKVETLVVVTDEKENDPGPETGLYFHELVQKYRATVSPNLRVVLVSFLAAAEEGEMATLLASNKVPFLQCRLNGERPDLTKLDDLLGKLSSETPLHVAANRVLKLTMAASTCRWDETFWRTFANRFVMEGAVPLFEQLSAVAAATPNNPDLVPEVVDTAVSLACALPDSDFSDAFLSDAAAITTPQELLQWSETWHDRFRDYRYACQERQLRRGRIPLSGRLAELPHEVLLIAMEYCPPSSVRRLGATCKGFRRMSYEALFDKQLTAPQEAFADELRQLDALGLLKEFPVDSVKATLAKAKGNVEQCVAMLFGDDDAQPQPHARGGRRGGGGW